MAKSISKTTTKKDTFKSILSKEDHEFMKNYLNNFSPTGFEWKGQKIWLDFLKPYIDTYEVDNYFDNNNFDKKFNFFKALAKELELDPDWKKLLRK